MTHNHSVIKNTSIILGGDILTKIMSLALTIIITRMLGVEGFGAFSFALGFGALFIIIADLGVDNYLKREISRREGLANHFVSNAFYSKSFLSIAAIIVTVGMAAILGNNGSILTLVLIATLTLVAESLTGIFNAAFIATQKVAYTTVIKLGRVVFRVIVSALVLFNGGDAKDLLLVFLAAQILSFITHAAYYHYRINPFRWLARKEEAIRIVKKGLPFGLATFFIAVYFKIDITMLQQLQGETAVGIYSAAYNLLEALYYIPIALTTALLPVTTHLYDTSKRQLKKLANQSSRFLFAVSLPIAFGTTALADKIIQFVYGDAYSASAQALIVLIWTIVPSFYTYMLGLMLVCSNNEKLGVWITGSAALINITINALLIPHYGFMGAAIATIITELALVATDYYFVGQTLFKLNVTVLAKPLIASIIMGATLYIFDAGLFFSIIMGAAIYVGVMVLIKGITKTDLKDLKLLTEEGGR